MAKTLVLQHAAKYKVNYSWIAERIGEDVQKVHQWLTLKHAPRDPTAWVRIADALGISPSLSTELTESMKELAVQVLVKSEDPELRNRAANIVREISRKYPIET